MKQHQIPQLGPLEFALVRMLWRHGPATAKEVQALYNRRRGRDLAYTTVMTLLTRLAEKGVLRVDRKRQPFEFTPLITKEQLVRQRVEDFVELFFNGQAVDLAVRLVEETDLSQESIVRLEEVLRRHRKDSETAESPETSEGESA